MMSMTNCTHGNGRALCFECFKAGMERTRARRAAWTQRELPFEPQTEPKRRLSEQEISRGLFRNGARELHFVDGRPAVRNLAVATGTIEALLNALQFAMA